MKKGVIFIVAGFIVIVVCLVAWRVEKILAGRQHIQRIRDNVDKFHGELKFDDQGNISSIVLRRVAKGDDLSWISAIDSKVSITFWESQFNSDDLGVENPGVVELIFLRCQIVGNISKTCFPNLEWLIISQCTLSENTALDFSSSNLKCLKVSESEVPNSFWKNISSIDSLEKILVSKIDSFTDHDANFLGHLSNLEFVWFFRTNLTGECFEEFGSRDRIRILNMENSKFNDAGCANVSRFLNLEFLNAANTNVTDKGVIHLAELPHIEYLYLSGSKITAKSREILLNLPQITVLLVNDTPVEDLSHGETPEPYLRY